MGQMGFFTDVTLCIGCKACEVACKQWNQLPEDGLVFTARSYDNTGALGATTWRHVAFVEREVDGAPSWLMMSDVCKHCERAACLDACPTGSILRTEHGSVYVQPDICNGCGYCVPACPFGVVDRLEPDGRAYKCTLCYDRLQAELEPACAKACPTDSIVFGELGDLRARAAARVEELQARGATDAYLYGADASAQPGTDGLHAFFLLVAAPEVYGLPPDPVAPTKKIAASWAAMAVAAIGVAAAAALAVVSTRRGAAA